MGSRNMFGHFLSSKMLSRLWRSPAPCCARYGRGVLDLSKIEAGKLELNPQTVQLLPLIDESSAPRDSSPIRTRTASQPRPQAILARSALTPCACGKSCSIY